MSAHPGLLQTVELIATTVALWSFAAVAADAQLQIILHDPPAAHMHLEALWLVDLINSGSDERTILLVGRATLEPSGQWVASGVSSPVTIPPGFSSLTPADLSPIEYDADPWYDNIITSTGLVPTGEYTICVYAVDATTRDTLAFKCIRKHVVLNVSPPFLIYPEDNSTLSEPLPVFTWAPVTPEEPQLDITYRLQIVEIVGEQSPFAALESNPSFYEEVDLSATVHPYSLSAEMFEPGVSYAWQITAHVQDQSGGQGELARSEAWAFTFGASDSAIDANDSAQYREPPGDPDDPGPSRPPENDSLSARQPDEPESEQPTPFVLPTGSGQPHVLFQSNGVDTNGRAMRASPAATPYAAYAHLRKHQDAAVYSAVGFLRFVYDNPYRASEVRCQILDEKLREVAPSPITLKPAPGRNYFTIDLRAGSALSPNRYFSLIVTDDRGESMTLRFIYHACPTCPDDPSEKNPNDTSATD